MESSSEQHNKNNNGKRHIEDSNAPQNADKNSPEPTKQEKSSTGEGIPNKTVRAGTEQGTTGLSTPFGIFPGNDGEGGDYYKSLQEKRARELPKSNEYEKQFAKDSISEKLKSLFS